MEKVLDKGIFISYANRKIEMFYALQTIDYSL
jgi:hypothetical protein